MDLIEVMCLNGPLGGVTVFFPRAVVRFHIDFENTAPAELDQWGDDLPRDPYIQHSYVITVDDPPLAIYQGESHA